ncbi:MAG: hypothetical protein ABW211_03585 [Acidimicrobiia bacterium]
MRGRSCFTWGAVLYVLTGTTHALAHFAPPLPYGATAVLFATAAARAKVMPAGGA